MKASPETFTQRRLDSSPSEDGMGFLPGAGTAVSIFWSFGGKQLHWNHVKEVAMPAIEMGLPPYSYLPFK
ncbi:MAG: hypothetical protein EZS26_001298 [Candidatus Ordinivivax streblomastigis]|uniref:Uncharacterized protein n=1 Tax=Candidatus Ordinivivax streblomastigis TaxID=2540710 RepID=A0A5M8P2A5_9BACT|nr:MAG: hypothetical protein EZS26_001298 [Candidatus Ordinivivax streblomastigis]